jgi:molybdopterin-guanine dinucleotide biosynthesis protein A
MDLITISATIDAYQNNADFDFYAHKNSDFYEPFCGIYTSKGLRKVTISLAENTLAKHSFQCILNQNDTLTIPINNLSAFKNYNN